MREISSESRPPIVRLLLLLIILGTNLIAAPARAASSAPLDFTRQIRPLLSENCFTCHGPDEKKRKAGLRLDLKSEAFRKQKSDATALVPGDLAHSELFRRITSTDDDDKMPPPKSGKHLNADQIELLKRWIESGAEYKEHWSYTKPECPARPEVALTNWPRNELDYFVLARLEKEGLRPSMEASRETLIRRVSLDLIGLPPTVEEVEQFVRDNRPEAYEELVERLLASPHYGERWARPWLDQARYADSNGYEADFRRTIWPYRDWVINAFNRDLPFDQFTIEQLAGDLLPNATREQKIATGFHRNTMVNTEGGTDDEEFRVAALVDRVNTTFGVWMGTTIGCAQCHSHKYDPFTQREYYQVMAFFNQTKDKGRSNEPEMELPTPAQQRQREELQAKIRPLEKTLKTQTSALDRAQELWESDLLRFRESEQATWQPLEPETMTAANGVELIRQQDGSILSQGALPDTSVYEVTAMAKATGITAIRLETLADDRLPQKSCGRSEDGDFVLTEFTVQAVPLSETAEAHLAAPKLGSWHSVGPFQAENVRDAFKRAFIAEGKVDLNQTFDEGKLRWTLQSDWKDGAVHPLTGENCATYLVRTVTTDVARPLMISLGSDDGLQVWLNGSKVLAKEVERGAAPNQDSVELHLNKGENQLLLKINNGAGDSGFYFAVSDDQQAAGRLTFETAAADISMERYDVKDAFDGKPKTGWSIAAFEPVNRVNHEAVFVLQKPASFPEGTRLRFRLYQESDRSQHLLGRFRLSLSSASADGHRLWAGTPAAVRRVLEIARDDRSEDQQRELEAFYRSIEPSLDGVRSEMAALRKQEPKDIASTLVMEPVEKHRTTHMLVRGSHLNPGDEVTAGTPAILHAWPAGAPTNRLGFAEWLIDPSNALVRRVTLNRIWAQYFGRGLVETSEEFGSQGELPSHPELMDWLAAAFLREHWSIKAMHRLIVTSATYRQSSDVSPELAERDPFNRLLARGPRFRMEAEMLRDFALSVGGLLSEKIGGPSVFPFQPEGVWNSPYNGDRWAISKNGDQFRRGLYTFWRRTAPYAAFSAFDAPSREVMCERRPRSNTPVQALVTLNDPAFIAAANGLAQRILAHGGQGVPQQLAYGFSTCLSRMPEPREERRLLQLFEETRSKFMRDPAAAKALVRIGNDSQDAGSEGNLAERAAWVVIGNVLLNLDETLTKG